MKTQELKRFKEDVIILFIINAIVMAIYLV